MKNRSRNNVTILLAFAVSLMALSITGGLRAQEPPPQECIDLDEFHGCVDSCTECGDCDELCENAEVPGGCIADDKWKQCDVDADYCEDDKIYWECACVAAPL